MSKLQRKIDDRNAINQIANDIALYMRNEFKNLMVNNIPLSQEIINKIRNNSSDQYFGKLPLTNNSRHSRNKYVIVKLDVNGGVNVIKLLLYIYNIEFEYIIATFEDRNNAYNFNKKDKYDLNYEFLTDKTKYNPHVFSTLEIELYPTTLTENQFVQYKKEAQELKEKIESLNNMKKNIQMMTKLV